MEDTDHIDDSDDVPDVGIAEVLRKLPLCDELYLGMHAMNLDVVDQFLEQQEARLLTEYMETERTPFPTVMFVSALSQMWMFALYELLRTWRQRARDVLRWAKEIRSHPIEEWGPRLATKKREIRARARASRASVFWPAYEQAAKEADFVEALRAIDRTGRLFRRIEAVRMSWQTRMPGMKITPRHQVRAN
jgi:hypothetical protein